MKCIVRNTIAIGAFALIGSSAVAKADTYFPNDATINYELMDYAVVGYANSADYNSKTNKTSPTINLSLHGHLDYILYAYNSSTINANGGSGHIQGFDKSVINVSSGNLLSIDTYATSAAKVTGGHLGSVTAINNSTVNVTGGTIDVLDANGNATVNVSGGNISTSFSANNNTGIVDFSGGIISGYLSASNSTVNVSGGSIGQYLTVSYAGTINIFGTNLSATLIDPAYQLFYSRYSLSGTLADGTVLTNERLLVQNEFNSKFTLNNTAVPEPGSLALLLGMATIGLSVLRKHRKG